MKPKMMILAVAAPLVCICIDAARDNYSAVLSDLCWLAWAIATVASQPESPKP